MSETNLSVSEAALGQLLKLAKWSGLPFQQTLERAIQEFYDRQFWIAVDARYAVLRAEPTTWAEVEAERHVWESTLMDGLDPSEQWTQDGGVTPLRDQKQAP
jgi:hypothetical protein